jgi:hypothetical protein
MTTKRRAKKRRREDDRAAEAPSPTRSSEERAGPAPAGHALLQLQAQRGNAAVQRLVEGAPQLQRQLEGEDEDVINMEELVVHGEPSEQADAEADSDQANPQTAMMLSMWNAGVLEPLSAAFGQIEDGSEEALTEAYNGVVNARGFVFQMGDSVREHFPDAESDWIALAEGVQLIMVMLQPHVGAEARPLDQISGHLDSVIHAAQDFTLALQGI